MVATLPAPELGKSPAMAGSSERNQNYLHRTKLEAIMTSS
jgi:hypothetical protein